MVSRSVRKGLWMLWLREFPRRMPQGLGGFGRATKGGVGTFVRSGGGDDSPDWEVAKQLQTDFRGTQGPYLRVTPPRRQHIVVQLGAGD